MLGLWITLAVLLALAIFLWRLRLGLYVVFGRGQAAADLTIGPFRVRLVPSKEAKKTPQETKKTGKPKKEPKDLAEAAKKIPKPKLEDLQDAARTLWPAAKKALRRTRRGIRVDPLRLSATLGGAEDPAAAAELYGGLHALVWTGMPALEKLVVIRDPGIHLGIDFDAQETRAEGELGISIRLGTLIAVGKGKIPPEAMGNILAAKDRTLAGATAPARGLCMCEVFYPGLGEEEKSPWESEKELDTAPEII